MSVLSSRLRLPVLVALVAALVAVPVGVVISLTTPEKASAATTKVAGYQLKAGPKLGRGTEWMGSYALDGHAPGYCIDYGKQTPHAVNWRDVRSLPRMTGDRFARMSYLLSRYGNTRSNTQAAALNAALNLLVGNAGFASDWKNSYVGQLNARDRGVVPLANRMISESAANRGPYRVSVRITKAAAVGGTGTAAVTVTSAARKAMADMPLRITLRNAKAARKLPVSTGRSGSVGVSFVPAGAGAVTVGATVSNLVQFSLIRLSTPTGPAVQRLASAAAPRTSAAAQATYGAAYPVQNLAMSMACTTDCYGRPPITVTGTNSSTRDRLQVFLTVAGKPLGGANVLTLAPGRSGKVTIVVKDGDRIGLVYRWQRGSGWTGMSAYGKPLTVNCPPAALVDFVVDCPCDGLIVASVRDRNTTRYQHAIAVQVGGKTIGSMTVAAGRTGTLSGLKWARGATATVYNQNYLNGRKVGGLIRVTTLNFG